VKSASTHLTLVAGARPNFMKVAALVHALHEHNRGANTPITFRLVHTGQHYDRSMSGSFFEDLGLPAPDANLGVGSGTHAQQTAAVLVAFEQDLLAHPARLVVVVGDVNSTLACALAAKKLCVPVAHVEAGLRSFDRSMPEEVNRIVTDQLSDLLFTPDEGADENLRREGVPPARIHRTGNVMIDTLLRQRERARDVHRFDAFKARGPYGLVTLHRPSNVDDEATLRRLAQVLGEVAEELPLLLPCHPRTKARLQAYGIRLAERITVTEPLSYLDMLNLLADARVVFTDSGGVQEETTALGVPCLTLRASTERPVTVRLGTNVLVGTDPERIRAAFAQVLAGRAAQGAAPPLWDGRAGERVVRVLADWLADHAEETV